jgi:hypothetical protein
VLRKGEPSIRPIRTITGDRIAIQEDLGMYPRRSRLMVSAIHVLADDKLAKPSSAGVPLGAGHGMEPLVERIRPLFEREASLIRWVAYRGALRFLDMVFATDGEWRVATLTMGLEVGKDPSSGEHQIRAIERPGPIPRKVKGQITGLFSSISLSLEDYQEIAEASVQAVNANPRWQLDDGMALDYIAWTAIAMLRTGKAKEVLGHPEPGMLEYPGWYADPLLAQAERYWDGTDWTARMRVAAGKRWQEFATELRPRLLGP